MAKISLVGRPKYTEMHLSVTPKLIFTMKWSSLPPPPLPYLPLHQLCHMKDMLFNLISCRLLKVFPFYFRFSGEPCTIHI